MIEQTVKVYENGITTKVDVITANGNGFFLTMTIEEGDIELTPRMIHFLNNESVQKFSDFLNEKLQPFLYESVTYGTKILLEQFLIEAVKFIENETDYELEMRGEKIFNLKQRTPYESE